LFSIKLPTRLSARVGLAAAILAVAATPASATVTSSQIDSVTTPDGVTSSADPLFSGYNSSAPTTPQMTVSGRVATDDANAADAVDIRCYYGNSYSTLTSNVTVAADGTFTTTDSSLDDTTCRLSAVPTGYGDPLDAQTFAGPRLGLGYQNDSYRISGGPNDQLRYDFFSDTHQLLGYSETESSGNGGIVWTQPFDAAFGDYGSYSPWNDAAALYTYSSGDGWGHSEIRIDGKDAYNTRGAYDLNDDGNGHFSQDNGNFPNMSFASVTDPLTGDNTVTESEPLVDCGTTAFPADASCGGPNTDQASFNETGVRFDRNIKQSKGGLQQTVTDTYTSTDGQEHALDVQYDNYSYFNDQPLYKFPGSSGYHYYSHGDTVDLPAQAVGSIKVQQAYYGNSPDYGVPGAVTYLSQPDRAYFNYSSDEFALEYRRTVPAGGSLTITHVFSTAQDGANVDALAASAEDAAQAPTVAIASPANGATVNSTTLTVTGTATDDQGAPSLKVNGMPTAVASDGTWSQQVTLPSGSNTITAVATDAAGNQGQAHTTVVEAGGCTVPNVVNVPTAQAIAGLKAASCALGVQSGVTASKVKKGYVAVQSVAPGSSISSATPVNIGISTGALKKVALSKKRVRLHSRHITLTLKCPSGSPATSGKVSLQSSSGTSLGSRTFKCTKAGNKTVQVNFSSSKAKSLRRHASNSVKTTITSQDTTGESAVNTLHITILGH
jgi:hypothetical protein